VSLPSIDPSADLVRFRLNLAFGFFATCAVSGGSMENQQLILILFFIVLAFYLGKLYGIEIERQRRAKEDARWRAQQKGEQIDESDRDWWLKH
jgi:hypothetical protein